jgi:hypothetical protein
MVPAAFWFIFGRSKRTPDYPEFTFTKKMILEAGFGMLRQEAVPIKNHS